MLIVVTAALAHSAPLPHVHPPDPASVGLAAFWLVALAAFGLWARGAGLRASLP